MIEVAGAALGGLFRLAPEVLKLLDAKNERKHELAMLDRQIQLDAQKAQQQIAVLEGQQELAQIQGQLANLGEAIRGQFQKTGIRFVDAAVWLVRPLVTYILLYLYVASKVAGLVLALDEDNWAQALILVYDAEDRALLSGILAFWFVGRVFDKDKGAR